MVIVVVVVAVIAAVVLVAGAGLLPDASDAAEGDCRP